MGFDVENVVPVVRAARREAERRESDEGLPQRRPLVEHTGRSRSRDDQHVLRPLLGTRLAHMRADAHAATGAGVIGSRPTRTGTFAIANI